MPVKRVCVIGCGAMGVYTLKHLISTNVPLSIVMLEAGDSAGDGMPYGETMNADYMLCNAFSREIPSITRPLVNWLSEQPLDRLSQWGVAPDDIDSRAFYPRLLIGAYLRSELQELTRQAEQAGHEILVLTRHDAFDIEVGPEHLNVRMATPEGDTELAADTVFIATGHRWDQEPAIDQATLLSPWPYTRITGLPAQSVGILGSSLSAVDILVALGKANGQFLEQGENLIWQPHETGDRLRICMLSRNGIMPEGDFYYPFPYEAADHLTVAAVDLEIRRGTDGLLHRLFQLLMQELETGAPDYFKRLGDAAATPIQFAHAYFKDREERGGLRSVKQNLAEVRASERDKVILAHRYALLKSHENLEAALPHLSEADWDSFSTHLMPVLADCYAAIPHVSLARIIALYDAGVLTLVPTGEDAHFSMTADDQVQVRIDNETCHFDCVIDARGQSAAPLGDLPFPSLIKSLKTSNEPLKAPFSLQFTSSTHAQAFCLAMPQVLQRYPFSQGLSNCCELARTAVHHMLEQLQVSA